MHPALSVIFFTTASGAGYGLLVWVAFAGMTDAMPARALLVAVLVALVLVTAGLASSFLHLGKPMRAWRAFSQWRTSWLSREGLASAITYLPVLALAVALLPGALDGTGTGLAAFAWPGMVAGVLTIVGALVTLVCTAMIYASLKPIPAWAHRSVPPVYLVFALSGGALLLAGIAALHGIAVAAPALAVLAVLALVPWPLKWRYWRDIDTTPLSVTRGDAVGLPARKVARFEGPTTEANYITREMGFVLARKHARTLRIVAVLLFTVLPLACVAVAWMAGMQWLLVVAAVAAIAGAFVERWLFFAQARHMVTLYY
ncbi:MAG TPA: DmsC/YnfH family molybdoenzyme membrane anchor subunit [Xanthomonadaceae bacterium]|nr:DmsC/YnfH family molybdoenzyme membrane anchor subunit [Xanthomonadaceae bacterium]